MLDPGVDYCLRGVSLRDLPDVGRFVSILAFMIRFKITSENSTLSNAWIVAIVGCPATAISFCGRSN